LLSKRAIIGVVTLVIAAIVIIILYLNYAETQAVENLEFKGVYGLDIDTNLVPPSIDFYVTLIFYNPSLVTASLKDFSLNMIVNDSIVANFQLEIPISIQSNAYGYVDTSASLSSLGIASSIWNIVTTGDFDYSLSGTATVSKLFGDVTIPIEYTSE
jgi:LEA14-like dessication related protein